MQHKQCKYVTRFSCRRDIVWREHKSCGHIVSLKSRQHIFKILPRFRRRTVTKLSQHVRPVEHHWKGLAYGQTVTAAVVGILGHGVTLKTSLNLIKVAELRHINEQVTGGKVHGELSAEEKGNIRTLSCKSRFNNSACYKVDRYWYTGILHESVLCHFLYDLSLIPSEGDPYLYCVLSLHIGKSGIILKKRAYKSVKSEFQRLSQLFVAARETPVSCGKFYIVNFKRLIAVFPHPCGQGRDTVLYL